LSIATHVSGPLPLKARVGSYSVVMCTPDRLELRGHRGMSVGMILGGLFVCAFGVLDWWAFLTNNGHASMRGLVLPIVGAVVIAGGVTQLGAGLVFDRNGRAMRKGKLSASAGAASDSAGALFRPRHVVAIEIVPTNLHQRESVAVRVEVPGAQPVLLGIRRTKERDAATLLAGAGHIANLIDAPVRVTGESKEGSEAFRYTLDALRALSRPIPPESLAA
jgi:hypothetical protein